MVKIVIPLDDHMIDGTSTVIKMGLGEKDCETVDAAVQRIKESAIVEIDPEDFKEEKTSFLLALTLIAIGAQMPNE